MPGNYGQKSCCRKVEKGQKEMGGGRIRKTWELWCLRLVCGNGLGKVSLQLQLCLVLIVYRGWWRDFGGEKGDCWVRRNR